MAQHCNNLLRLALLEQSVIDDDVLLPRKTVEVSVTVSTALAAINDVQLRERELELLGQVLDTGLDLTGLQRRQLVEQRQDDDGVDSNSENLDEDTEQPQIVEERVTRLLDDLEHSADDRCPQHDTEHLTLEHIRDPELQRLLVETELLLEDECVVVRDRERENSAEYVETENEHERLRDLSLELAGKIPCQQETADAPKLREDIAVDENEILDLTIETGDETELGLCAAICLDRYIPHEMAVPLALPWTWRCPYLGLIEDFLRNLTLDHLGRRRPLENLVLPKRQETLQDKLPQRESHEHVLPWEERTVEKTRKLLATTLVSHWS